MLSRTLDDLGGSRYYRLGGKTCCSLVSVLLIQGEARDHEELDVQCLVDEITLVAAEEEL